MQPLKIAFVLDDGLDKPDGVQQNIITLGQWLSSQGHEVSYIVGESKRSDIKNVISISKNLNVAFNNNTLTIPLYSSKRKIKNALLKGKFDIIHVQVPYNPLMAARLIKMADKSAAIVGTFHILPSNYLAKYGTKLLSVWLSRNLKRFDRHLAVSEPAKLFAKQAFGINCRVLPNPVHIKKYKSLKNNKHRKASALKIVFLGRLVNRKGCQYLINAVRTIHKKALAENDFNVDIYGDGQLKLGLKHLVDKYKLDSLITLHGFVSEEEKVKIFQQADICVFPSISGESFGIVLVEAMAADSGVIIAGDNEGYRSVLGSVPECLVQPNKTDKLAYLLADLINSDAKRQQLKKRQQKLVGQYDVDVIGKKLLAIYNDCIKRKKSR